MQIVQLPCRSSALLTFSASRLRDWHLGPWVAATVEPARPTEVGASVWVLAEGVQDASAGPWIVARILEELLILERHDLSLIMRPVAILTVFARVQRLAADRVTLRYRFGSLPSWHTVHSFREQCTFSELWTLADVSNYVFGCIFYRFAQVFTPPEFRTYALVLEHKRCRGRERLTLRTFLSIADSSEYSSRSESEAD
ncbi:unnamed protein product [Symbiodinium natans]|uniref:Uncharacterized protein n=1 Tax=Symbiodinium natans TaxID=878477 RepID=A0A812KLR9_9DINO|nr:unnamed protein product [Symbiodinium natans]